MDSGWAVVLGASIALAGSSIIPWVRDEIAAWRQARSVAEQRRKDAVTALLGANGKLAFANAFGDRDRVIDAYGQRAEAAAELLLQVGDEERTEIAVVLERAVPFKLGSKDTSKSPRGQMLALQSTLVDWAVGAVAGEDVSRLYERRLAEEAPRLQG